MNFYKKTPQIKVEKIEDIKQNDDILNSSNFDIDELIKTNEKNNQEKEKTDEKETITAKFDDNIDSAMMVKTNNFKFLNEIGKIAIIILLISLFSLFGMISPIDSNSMINLGSYSFCLDLITWGTVIFLGITLASQLCFFLFNPSKETPKFKKTSSLVYYVILIACGIAGFDLLLCLFNQSNYANLPVWISFYLASVIALFYDYIITKLFAYDKISDKNMFWEIVRFALVGIIASVFDFATTYGMRLLLASSSLSETIITIIAVTMGFIVGVIVNYLCSVYMVYKASTKSNAKTWYGMLLFVVLSAFGLIIGIGLEALFYDYLKWTYILVFIIRTLVVMIWNYISRKLFIFK